MMISNQNSIDAINFKKPPPKKGEKKEYELNWNSHIQKIKNVYYGSSKDNLGKDYEEFIKQMQ